MECRPTTLDACAWDAAVSAAGGALQQAWAWGAACGGGVERLEVTGGGRPLALAQVVRRGRLPGLLSRGPVLTDPAAPAGPVIAAIAAHAMRCARAPLIVTPPAPPGPGMGPHLPLMTAATVAVWNLAPGAEAVRAGLHQKWRNRLVGAEAAGVTLDEALDLGWLLAREAETRLRARYRGLPAELVTRLWRGPEPVPEPDRDSRPGGLPPLGPGGECGRDGGGLERPDGGPGRTPGPHRGPGYGPERQPRPAPGAGAGIGRAPPRGRPSAAAGGPPERRHLLLAARVGGEVAAAALFLVHGQGATYQIGWTGPEGRRLGAMALILWQAALRLKVRGVTWLDLGLIDTEGAPGLARFKLGTGAGVRRLGATALVCALPGALGRLAAA